MCLRFAVNVQARTAIVLNTKSFLGEMLIAQQQLINNVHMLCVSLVLVRTSIAFCLLSTAPSFPIELGFFLSPEI